MTSSPGKSSKKLFVLLQSPVVPMLVTAIKDCSGASATCTALFKRYDVEEAAVLGEQFDALLHETFITSSRVEEYKTAIFSSLQEAFPDKIEENVRESEKSTKKFLKGKTVISEEGLTQAEKDQAQKISNFLTSQIVGLQQVTLEVVTTSETGESFSETLYIKDTATVEDAPDLWGEAKNCFPLILKSFLASNPWRAGLIQAQQKVLINLDFASEAEAKNY